MKRFALGVLVCALLAFLPKELSAQTPQISPGGIVNGASFARGVTVAPGSIASVFGSNFGSTIAGVTLRMNGIIAPLFAVSPQQINFEVPWELAGLSEASLTVTVGGVTSSPVTVALATYGPGIFVANSSGQGAILIAGSSSVAAPLGAFPGSRPVVRGEIISIYVTGLGPVTNRPPTGAPASGEPLSTTTPAPTVSIGTVLGAVQFSGLAPGFIGLYQVNVAVPSNANFSNAEMLTVSIGGVTSNQVRIAISSAPPLPSALFGPHPQDVGLCCGVPPGGDVRAIAVDPSGTGTLYAATTGGVFKSTNGGANWMAANSGLLAPSRCSVDPCPLIPVTSYSALAIDPSKTATVYVGTDAGVFKSTNGGVSWAAANSGLVVPGCCPVAPGFLVPVSVSALAIDPSDTATVYAVGGGVFKSTNGGASWTAANSGLPSGSSTVPVLVIDPSNTATLYLGTSTGVFKSGTGGSSWAAVNSGLQIPYTSVVALTIDPSNTATVYAGALDAGVFKSTNGGAFWAAASSGLPAFSSVSALAIDPSNTSTVYAATSFGGLSKSTNGGANWAAVNSGLPNTLISISGLAIDPSNGATVYAGTFLGWGVFKSTNRGASWAAANSGLTNTFVNALAIDRLSTGTVYAGTGGGVFKSTDGGTSWSGVNSGLQNPYVHALAIDPSSSAALYAGTEPRLVITNGPAIFKSTDGAASWALSNSGLTPGGAVIALAIDPSNTATVYFATDALAGVFKSTDGGASWAAANSGLFRNQFYGALAIDPSNTATVYAAGAGVFKSTDGGSSWTSANSGLTVSGVQALAIDPSNTATVYAGTRGGGIFKTTNGGAGWAAVNSGLPTVTNVLALAIDPSNTATVYAGTSVGVFKSTNGEARWLAADFGLTNTFVRALAIDPSSTVTVYAGTQGGGVFKSTDGGQSWKPTGAN